MTKASIVLMSLALIWGCAKNNPGADRASNNTSPQKTLPAMQTTSPLKLETGRPVVAVMINGHGPYDFILDTGAPKGGMISSALVEELGLAITGQTEVSSPLGGTPAPANIVQIDSLSVGAAEARNLELWSLQSGPRGPGLGDGVIGPAVFSDHVVTLDFTTNTLHIGSAPSGDPKWISFGESAPLLDAEVEIGSVRAAAHIDTGAMHVVSFPDALADQLPLEGPLQVVGRARTVDREFEIKGAPLNRDVLVGEAAIPVRMATFAPLPVVNIGAAAMPGLILTIDFPNERFAISGASTPAEPRARRVRVRQGE